MYEKARFPRTSANEELFDLLSSIKEAEEPLNIFISGDTKVGKSILASNACKLLHEKQGLFCAVSDLTLRLSLNLEEEETFFDRIGSTPVLFLDDFDAAFEHDATAYLVILMLQERQRQGLSTILISRKKLALVPYDAVSEMINPSVALLLNKCLGNFTEYKIEPLDAENRREAIAYFANEFSDGKVTIDDAAAADIEASVQDISDIETLIKHVTMNAREQGVSELTIDNIEGMLTKNSIVDSIDVI